ncbi:hypothetical protein [Mucilaginibacter aquatilis]|uniref:Uncharacterized protein n=1 Tax=Mucilaginibacter aquatilis TaxID=1517760 RepID=A0A6I4I914_9SPHI|nr:hypothetical protein [Mucilaginibacter aquatilis]MVN90478.1 hypothetical protein [Mucilaginibacter aquatilis]
MNAQLQQIQSALKEMVLTYIEAQKVDIESSYDARVNAAETNIRVIANKRLPFSVYDLMKHLHVLDEIEFESSEASVQYVVQIIASITNFTTIWERCLSRWGNQGAAQVALQNVFELCDSMKSNYQTITAFAANS